MAESNDTQVLQEQAEAIRNSGVLGRSGALLRLFGFLLERSAVGRSAKEIEVALDVFGKDAQYDVSQDSMVRVYVHKLRRKLHDYYAEQGRESLERISIPKGEYRLCVETVAAAAPPNATPKATSWTLRHRLGGLGVGYLLTALCLSIALNIGLWICAPRTVPSPIRSSSLWAPILRDSRPITIVVGDYYIFGEIDEAMNVRRLVREFSINSRGDFDDFIKQNPRGSERYVDLDLSYLPTSTAFALRDVMAILAEGGRADRIHIVLSSDLTAGMIKSSNVIYVGMLSGFGMLRDIVFGGSRFAVTDSYDELTDERTHQSYISQAAVPIKDIPAYKDYGYLASFSGPSHNRIIVISGTRDVAVMQMAEVATTASKLEELWKAGAPSGAFEALYEVSGIDRVNLRGRLLTASAFDDQSIWDGHNSNIELPAEISGQSLAPQAAAPRQGTAGITHVRASGG